jgi:hypothetical protein
MADALMLQRAAMKVVWFVVVLSLGLWLLWPDVPVREWFNDNSDWKMKFAFIGWAAVTVGMAYDTIVDLVRAIMASPGGKRR